MPSWPRLAESCGFGQIKVHPTAVVDIQIIEAVKVAETVPAVEVPVKQCTEPARLRSRCRFRRRFRPRRGTHGGPGSLTLPGDSRPSRALFAFPARRIVSPNSPAVKPQARS